MHHLGPEAFIRGERPGPHFMSIPRIITRWPQPGSSAEVMFHLASVHAGRPPQSGVCPRPVVCPQPGICPYADISLHPGICPLADMYTLPDAVWQSSSRAGPTATKARAAHVRIRSLTQVPLPAHSGSRWSQTSHWVDLTRSATGTGEARRSYPFPRGKFTSVVLLAPARVSGRGGDPDGTSLRWRIPRHRPSQPLAFPGSFLRKRTHRPFLFPRWSSTLLVHVIFLAVYGGSRQSANTVYRPSQPVPFSHALHAGELGMGCRYCPRRWSERRSRRFRRHRPA